jgi:hypothetical protein
MRKGWRGEGSKDRSVETRACAATPILRSFTASILFLSLAFLTGCPRAGVIADYEKRVIQLQDSLKECETRRMSEKERYSQLVKRIQAGESVKFDPSRLFLPVEIQIDPLTGGSDWDGKPGDDGVTVYLRPIDRDGDVVKAAGDLRIEILDLENPPDRQLVGRYGVSVDELGKLWYGKLMTQHYTLECPWTRGRPQHDTLTVKVNFVEYVTQRTLTAQAVCKVKLPG